jgi:DNA-binding transcriptional MerR regulator/methylmalonyl-CoA mutase cobalamin-binding subunit
VVKVNQETNNSENDADVGRYRIQAVADMTGVSAATLRAWERRYGIPTPKRTASSYRLYSERDIELVKQVRELCDAGMAPSQAAREVLAREEASPPAVETVASETDAYSLAIDRILGAVDRFDADQLEAAVKHSLYLGPSVTVFERILAPSLGEIGRRWEQGRLSVGQEHLAAEIVGNAVRYILRLVQPESSGRHALLACFADEEHVTPLYGIALRFADWGFKTVMLGGRTPTHALRHAVAEVNPDIIGLSVTIAPPPYRARELVDGYAEACGEVPWIVGGVAAADIADLVQARGGALANADPQVTRELVERMIATRKAAARH